MMNWINWPCVRCWFKEFTITFTFVFLLLGIGCGKVVYIKGSKNAKASIEGSATGIRTDLSGDFTYCSQPVNEHTKELICKPSVK